MKLLSYGKDGGPDSVVSGFWLIEIKSLFSIVLLRFGDGSREAYHSHAFNSISWVLKGKLKEINHDLRSYWYSPSLIPIRTPRERFHKVKSFGTTWVLSFRGPWADKWKEYWPATQQTAVLSSGRKIESVTDAGI